MIERRPYDRLGHADHGWLDARHHFSFAGYHDADRMGFGPLRVINDDRIAAGRGFGAHPHDNMEIITYVRAGAITHQDSLGNKGRTGAGDVQMMSAGSGVVHAEHNLEGEETRLYQIWIEPDAMNVAPRWDMRQFPRQETPSGAGLTLLVSGRAADAGRGALFIHQDAAIYGGRLAAGSETRHRLAGPAYLLASQGSVVVNGVRLDQGDGAAIMDEAELVLTAGQAAELLLIELPAG